MAESIYGAAAPLYLAAGWAGVIPLVSGKSGPPRYATGRHPDIGPAEIEKWRQAARTANIALRLPDNVIGLDVDAYGDKPGAATLAELEAQRGPLPDTWISTSRDDGVSGIRLYRAPAGVHWRGSAGPGIDIIQRCHRYAVVSPSIHPARRTPYRWLAPGGATDKVPSTDDLAELPESWIEHLRRPTAPARPVGDQAHDPFTQGDPCPAVRRAFGRYEERRAGGARYDAMRDTVLELVRLGDQGHAGAGQAIGDLRTVYVEDVGDDRPGTDAEYDRALAGAEKLVAGSPTPEADRGCCAQVPEVFEVPAEWRTCPDGVLRGAAGPKRKAGGPSATDGWSVEAPAPSWVPVDMRAVFDGGYERPSATIGHRSDGIGLLYPGKEHSVASEPETGKTWLAGLIVTDELAAGGRVVYVDFEDDEHTIGTRLVEIGAPQEVLCDPARFRYVRPAEQPTAALYAALLDFDGQGPTLAVLDGQTEGYGLHGWKISDNDDSPKWRQTYVKPALRAGAATLSTDHVVKNPDNRNGFAIGAQHKKAGLTGVLFELVAVDPFGRGLLGRSRLMINKDRNGDLRQHGARTPDGRVHFADLVLDARGSELELAAGTEDLTAFTLELRPPEVTPRGAAPDKIDKLRDPIVKAMTEHDGQYPTETVLRGWLRADGHKVSNDDLRPALDRLEREGLIERPEYVSGKSRPGKLKIAGSVDG